jgi:hypothetical protein
MAHKGIDGKMVIDSFVYSCNAREKRFIEKYLDREISFHLQKHGFGKDRHDVEADIDEIYYRGYFEGMVNALNIIKASVTSEEEMVAEEKTYRLDLL